MTLNDVMAVILCYYTEANCVKLLQLDLQVLFILGIRELYPVSQKNIPDVFSYNSRKHWRIFFI